VGNIAILNNNFPQYSSKKKKKKKIKVSYYNSFCEKNSLTFYRTGISLQHL
jgi:hypothetical protein